MTVLPTEPYVSTTCLPELDSYTERLRRFEQAGIQRVELGFCSDPAVELDAITDEFVFNYQAHNYFYAPDDPFIINLASPNPSLRERSRQYVEWAIKFCAANGIDMYTVHAGFRTDPTLEFEFHAESIPSYDEAFERFVTELDHLAAFAAQRDVALGVENNVLVEYNLVDGSNDLLLLCEPWEIDHLFSTVSYDNLGLLLDLGHLRVTAETLDFAPKTFVTEATQHVLALHLHDNNKERDQHRPLQHDSWAVRIVSEYFDDPSLPITLETHFEDIETLQSTVTALTPADTATR